jgi:hypothetical protein
MAQTPTPVGATGSAPTIDKAASEDNVHIVLRGPDGKVKHDETLHNLITTAGRNAIVSRLASSPGSAVPTHMAIGTGATAAAAGDTTLQTELDRNALTSNTASTNVLTMVGDWAAGDGTGAITEAGVLSASSGGTLFARAVFSVINKAAGDTLQITWTFTLTVS